MQDVVVNWTGLDWLAIFMYLSIMILVGWYVSRKVRNSEDYLMAGRALSYPMVVATVAATWYGSGAVFGTAELAFNAGIAEQNAMAVAGGMAATGMKVFVHSFGCFASRRAFDQAYLACGYSLVPVHVIGSDPGVTAAYNGGTHMPFEDIGIMRLIPGVTVMEPTDTTMMRSLVTQMVNTYGVQYRSTLVDFISESFILLNKINQTVCFINAESFTRTA